MYLYIKPGLPKILKGAHLLSFTKLAYARLILLNQQNIYL